MMRPFTLKLRNRVVEYDRPQVMGIVNATPDSFYSGSRTPDGAAVARRVEELVGQGADWLDVGACSTRPGAAAVSADEELRRLRPAMKALREVAPTVPVSVDTYRAEVARVAVEELGADAVNDIAGGTLDPGMFATVALLGVPYILMHMRGTPATMQQHAHYGDDVAAEVAAELQRRLAELRALGVADVVVDPGFGFAKTVAHNYALLRELPTLALLDCPLLVGISRKSMVCRPTGRTPDTALAGTIALNALALERGAAFLRVHDVAAAVDARTVVMATLSPHSLH